MVPSSSGLLARGLPARAWSAPLQLLWLIKKIGQGGGKGFVAVLAERTRLLGALQCPVQRGRSSSAPAGDCDRQRSTDTAAAPAMVASRMPRLPCCEHPPMPLDSCETSLAPHPSK